MPRLGHKQLNEPILAHARSDFTALRDDQTVSDAIAALRGEPLSERIVYFYVVDRDERLVGILPTRRLLMSSGETPIASLMVTNVVALPHTAAVIDACEMFLMYRFLALPIVDDERRIRGVVDINLFADEVFAIAETRNAESVFQLIGVHLALGRRVNSWTSFKDRFPWLLCNIAGGLLCARLASAFSMLIDSVVLLALFIPIVLALAESVSIQSMTLTLRGLKSGQQDWSVLWKGLRHELGTALLIGLVSGGIVGLVGLLWLGHAGVAVVVAATICLSITTACLLGVIIPTVVHGAQFDPRIAAGPMVLALVDVCALLAYFQMAGVILST